MEGGVSANANNFVSEKPSSVVGKPELTPKNQRSSSRREPLSPENNSSCKEFAELVEEDPDWSKKLDKLSNHPDIKKIEDVDQFLQN